MSDLAETFQNDISQLFNERALLRTELVAKEKLLTEAIVQKNSLNQSLKQSRLERDELFTQNQKLKQEKLAAEAEKSASTIHVTILKEEKNLIEEKFYALSQQFEQARVQIDKLNREKQFLQTHQSTPVSIPIHHTVENRQELEELKGRISHFEKTQENLLQRHQEEIQVFKNEINAKDEQIQNLHRLLEEYEQTITSKEKIERDLHQRIEQISQSCRSEIPERMILSDEERRTLENDPNCSSILKTYRSSKSLFDILLDFNRLEKQNEILVAEREKLDVQRRQNEHLIHQLQSEVQQNRVQNDRFKFLAESRQNEHEQAVRDKQSLFKEKVELEKQLQHKQRELDDCLDDRLNMRAQIFHLLEQDGKSNHRSFSAVIEDEILGRQGVVTFQNVDELYDQYMKTLADIRETDRFILELEETHGKELKEIAQREFLLKESLDEIRAKFDKTQTDFQIESLAKQVLEREKQFLPKKAAVDVSQTQTDISHRDIQVIEENLHVLQNKSNEKDLRIRQLEDQIRLFQQKLEHFQKNQLDEKRKYEQSKRLLDETLERNKILLLDLQNSENSSEQIREKHRIVQYEFDRMSTEISALKSEIESLRLEKSQMNQLQEEVLDRVRKDLETRISEQDANSVSIKLQESVDELNTIMKECVKQTEITNGKSAQLSSLTKLEILYRQLQKRHQYDLERHFAISESLKIKAKDAQKQVEQLEQKIENLTKDFQEEQNKSNSKINELETKLRNADTTTVLTRLLPSATLESRLKEEEERTQQLRTWTNKLTEKIEIIQKQMATEKKEYEDKMEELRKELRDARAESDSNEKRYEDLKDLNEKTIRKAQEKEETLEMEIYKLKTDLDSSLITQQALREMISSRENELFQEQQRIVENETKLFKMEKEFFEIQEKYAKQKKDHNLPISEPPSPCVSQTEIIDDSKTPSKRRRNASSTDRTPVKTRTLRSQSVDGPTISNENDEMGDDNDDALSTCSEPPSAKKRKRRVHETSAIRLPSVNEEGDNVEESASGAQTPTYNLRSRSKKITKLQPHQTT